MVRRVLPLCCLALVACGSKGVSISLPGGGSLVSPPAYTIEPSPQQELGAATPIVAPAGMWTWVPVSQALCANGESTGFAVNLATNSNDLLIIYEGGGACYDAVTCYELHTASNVVDGYDASTFTADEANLNSNFIVGKHQDPNNPFEAMNMAFIPYCTGDVHDGNQVVTYTGASTMTYHLGFRNAQIYTQMLAATLPHATHVWISGDSAGGFGATFHYDDTHLQFPQARLDLLNDSGSSFPGIPSHTSWNLVTPSACADCNQNDFTTFITNISQANPSSRIGIMSYTQDTTLPLFFGITTGEFTADLTTYESFLGALPNAKYFVVSGPGHVLLDHENLTAGGESITSWLQQMVSDDPNWMSAK